MILKALAFNIIADHYKIINNIASSIFNSSIDIVDIKISEIELDNTDIVLVFGGKAARLVTDNLLYLKLPELSKLEDRRSNEETRELAYKSLLEFKEKINLLQEISIEDLDLTCDNILALEKSLKEKKETAWKGVTKNGKNIEISLTPRKKKNADIFLTFAEMYAIRTAMDTLEVEKIIVS